MPRRKEAERHDWERIKAEYITDLQASYRKLCTKYGVPFSTLRDRAKRENWVAERKKTQNKIVRQAAQKIVSRQAKRIAQELDPALEAAAKINQLVLDILNDDKQFRRHLVQRREKGFEVAEDGSAIQTERWWVEEQEFDVIDTRRLRDLAQALKISKELMRLLQGLLDPADEKRLQLEKERLELEKTKAGVGDGEDDDTGIVILPEVKSVDQEQQQQQEGADDEDDE